MSRHLDHRQVGIIVTLFIVSSGIGCWTSATRRPAATKPPPMPASVHLSHEGPVASAEFADLKGYLDGLSIDPDPAHCETVRRPAEPHPLTDRTQTTICPVTTAYTVDTVADFPAGEPGRVVARLVNEGDSQEHGLGIPSHATAYWAVAREPDTNGTAGRLDSYIIAIGADAHGNPSASVTKRLNFKVCHDVMAGKWDHSEAKFETDPACRTRQVGDPLQVSCVQGCCVASGYQ